MLGYTWATRGKIFLTNALVLLIAAAIGHEIDRLLHKKALFIFVIVIASFPLPTILIKRMVEKQKKQQDKERKLAAESVKK